MNTLKRLIEQIVAGTSKHKLYVVQHAHCGHLAGVFLDRGDALAKYRLAHSHGLRAWRVRLLVAGTDTKSTCSKCSKDLKVLRPSRRLKATT